MDRISNFAKHTFKLLIINLSTHNSQGTNIYLLTIVNKYMGTNQPKKLFLAYGFWWYFTKKDHSTTDKIKSNIIEQADDLYNDEKYLESYNLLSSYNKTNNNEINWRICRALYKMSRANSYDKQTNYAMILEAYDVINAAIKNHENSSEIHKWMAILLKAKLHFEPKFSKVEDNIRIKNYLIESNKLNPNDFTVLHMLGQWHYKFCTLSWFQKKLAAFLYNESPNCNYEDALTYFLKAEELRPRFYLSNIYMLGKINYQIGNMYKAHYYLAFAAQMIPNTDQEEKYVDSARNLVAHLKYYFVTDEVL